MTRVVQSIAITIPFIITLGVGLAGEEWSKDYWPAWVWASLTIGAVFLVVMYGNTKRAYELERALEPKLSISDPQEFFMPWRPALEGEPVNHHYFIVVTNISVEHVKNCSIRDSSFINNRGHESPVKGRFFRCRSERAADSKLHAYTRTFDLKGKNDSEEFDICSMDEGTAGSPIFMYYATTSTDQQKDSISRELFPHTLTVRVTADNLTVPETKTFKISVSDRGNLKMETLENGAR